MKKTRNELMANTIAYTQENLDELDRKGYKFFQIRGLTIDRHFDYTEPYYILLVPIKKLPEQQAEKDIYEPIDSEIFRKWVTDKNEYPKVLVAVTDK